MANKSLDSTEGIFRKHDRAQLARLRKNLMGGLAPIVDRYDKLGMAAVPYISQQLRYQLNVRQLILEAVDATIASDEDLRSLSQEELKGWRGEFSLCIERFVGGSEMLPRDRLAAFAAVEAAFVLGIAAGEAEHGSATLAKLRHERTREARAARRAEAVEEIIKAEALAYWKRKPDKCGKLSDTARMICPSVKAKLSEASGIPHNWRPTDSGNDASFIERIRKRLERLTSRTTDACPRK